jgi:hypothetical protein
MSTLIIHGTFDRDGEWWRVPRHGDFMQAVMDGMAAGGRQPDVWLLGGRHVSEYPELRVKDSYGLLLGRKAAPFQQIDGCFRWTGADYHGIGRMQGGEELARYLDALAVLQPGEEINLIAHSHGCNVVKVATQLMGRGVRLGTVAFLAGPHFEVATPSKERWVYPLNPSAFPRRGGAPPILNLYDSSDVVQKGLADHLADLGLPPGLPKLGFLGFHGTPVVNAHRTDPDPAVAHLYENVMVSQDVGNGLLSGVKAHGAVHGAAIGRLVGYWMARWPQATARQCCADLGIPAC